MKNFLDLKRAWRRKNPDFIWAREESYWSEPWNIVTIPVRWQFSSNTHCPEVLPAAITPPELLDYNHWTPQSEEVRSTKHKLRLAQFKGVEETSWERSSCPDSLFQVLSHLSTPQRRDLKENFLKHNFLLHKRALGPWRFVPTWRNTSLTSACVHVWSSGSGWPYQWWLCLSRSPAACRGGPAKHLSADLIRIHNLWPL